MLPQRPSTTLFFHCHQHRERRGPNSAVRIVGPTAAHDRTNEAAKQKAEQQPREQSRLATSVPFPSGRAAGFSSSPFSTVTKGKEAGKETESKKGGEQCWQERRACATFKLRNPAETLPVCLSTCSPDAVLKASLYANIHLLHRRRLRHRISECIHRGARKRTQVP